MARIDVDGDRDARVGGAVFDAVRVRGSGRSPWISLVVVSVLGAVLVLGAVGGNALGPTQPGDAAGGASTAPAGGLTASEPTVAPTRRPRASLRPAPGPPQGGPQQGGPPQGGPPAQPAAILELDLRPAGSHLFVHGDVFSIAVTSVSVALLDPKGRVAATERLRLPGGSRSFWTDPNPRFDVHFAVPDEMMADGLSIEVAAFDTDGGRLTTVRQPVTSPVGRF